MPSLPLQEGLQDMPWVGVENSQDSDRARPHARIAGHLWVHRAGRR